MNLLLAGLCLFGVDAHYVDSSLYFEGELLSWQLTDVEGDERRELVVALRRPDGERELRIYSVSADGVSSDPRHTVSILADIVAWSCADVREESGRELVLMTGAGAWSYSLVHPGYRDNVRPLVRSELVYDVADQSSLPYFAYVLPGAERDALLLPGRSGYSVWGPGDDDDGPYAMLADLALEVLDASAVDPDEKRGGRSVTFELGTDGPSPFLAADFERESALLTSSRSYRAPALVDLDGRAGLDMVARRVDALAVYLGVDGRLPNEPTRVEALPEVLRADGTVLKLVDLDRDGDLDLLAHVVDKQESLKNSTHQILLYTNDGKRLLSEQPSQVLRFNAAVLIIEVVDIDGDGFPDLSLRKLELPSFMGAVGGLEFTFSQLVYLHAGAGFERKPVLKEEWVYDEESVVDIISNRELVMDCDGDGIADLVELDVHGNATIRRLRREKSFFSGVTWSLEAAPWKRFDAGASIESLAVEDINGDGLGDLLSASKQRLTILVSRQVKGAR